MAKLLTPLNSEGVSGLYGGMVINNAKTRAKYASLPPSDNNREFIVPQLASQFRVIIYGKLTANIAIGFGRAESASQTPKEFLNSRKSNPGTWPSAFLRLGKFADLQEFIRLAIHIQTQWSDETILWARDFAASLPKPLPPFVENPRAPELVTASDEDMVCILFCALGQIGYPVPANFREFFNDPIPWDWEGAYAPSRPVSFPTPQSRAQRHEQLVAAEKALFPR